MKLDKKKMATISDFTLLTRTEHLLCLREPILLASISRYFTLTHTTINTQHQYHQRLPQNFSLTECIVNTITKSTVIIKNIYFQFSNTQKAGTSTQLQHALRCSCSDADMLWHLIKLSYYYYYFCPRKNEGGKKLIKVQRGLKWKIQSGWSSEGKPSCSNTALKC